MWGPRWHKSTLMRNTLRIAHTRHSMLFFRFLCLFSNKHLHYVGTSRFHPRDDISNRLASLDVFRVGFCHFCGTSYLSVCPVSPLVFSQNSNLLLITSSATNLHPKLWGICFCFKHNSPYLKCPDISVTPASSAVSHFLSCTDLRSNTALIGV